MTNESDFAVDPDNTGVDMLLQAEISAENVGQNEWESGAEQESHETNSQNNEEVSEPEARAYAPVKSENTPVETNTDEVQHAGRVVRIIDALRDLDNSDRDVAMQLIAQDSVDTEAESIISVLHVDPMLGKTLNALEEAKDLDQVQRAFYIMRTDRKVSQNLVSICRAFLQEEDGARLSDHIDLAEKLVTLVEDLSMEHMQYVAATQSLLKASKER